MIKFNCPIIVKNIPDETYDWDIQDIVEALCELGWDVEIGIAEESEDD